MLHFRERRPHALLAIAEGNKRGILQQVWEVWQARQAWLVERPSRGTWGDDRKVRIAAILRHRHPQTLASPDMGILRHDGAGAPAPSPSPYPALLERVSGLMIS